MGRFRKSEEVPSRKVARKFTDTELGEFHIQIKELAKKYKTIGENWKRAVNLEYYWYFTEGAVSVKSAGRYKDDDENEKLRGEEIKTIGVIQDADGATIKYERCVEKWTAYQRWLERKFPAKRVHELEKARETVASMGVEPL